MSASKIRSVGELREELAKYDDNNLILLEVRDEWGAVHDYSPFYIDVVEWKNNTEVRLCQIENTRIKY
jgi:hypothetical protein